VQPARTLSLHQASYCSSALWQQRGSGEEGGGSPAQRATEQACNRSTTLAWVSCGMLPCCRPRPGIMHKFILWACWEIPCQLTCKVHAACYCTKSAQKVMSCVHKQHCDRAFGLAGTTACWPAPDTASARQCPGSLGPLLQHQHQYPTAGCWARGWLVPGSAFCMAADCHLC
jgi:hypothetical protein